MLEQAFETIKKLEYGADVSELTAEVDMAIAHATDAKDAKAIEAGLLEIVNGDATQNGKDFACRALKIVGSDACVPTLAGLLNDEKLSHIARYALESLPGEASTKALLETLPKLSGARKAGAIASLGARHANSAVASLAALLNDPDATVARAAAQALGNIQTSDAAKALSAAKPNAAAVGMATDSSLACAEKMLASGDKTGALMIYKQLAKGDPPQHVKVAATRGMLACAGK